MADSVRRDREGLVELIVVVLSLSNDLYRVHGLEGKKALLEIRQEMITNHSLPYTEICLYAITDSTNKLQSFITKRKNKLQNSDELLILTSPLLCV